MPNFSDPALAMSFWGNPSQWAANALSGLLTHTTSTNNNLISVSANRTWVGIVVVSISITNAAAATTLASIQANVLCNGGALLPAAGNGFNLFVQCGAGAAGGTVGSQANEVAVIPFVLSVGGSTANIVCTTTITNGAGGRADYTAIGSLI